MRFWPEHVASRTGRRGTLACLGTGVVTRPRLAEAVGAGLLFFLCM